jgi:hypothetical protein
MSHFLLDIFGFFLSTGRLFIILFHFWRVEKVAAHWLTLVNPSKTEMIDKCVKLMSTGRDFHNEQQQMCVAISVTSVAKKRNTEKTLLNEASDIH